MTQHNIHSAIAALLLSAILAIAVSAASVTPAPAYSIMHESSSISSASASSSSTYKMMDNNGSGMGSWTNDPNKRWGLISSIQNDEDGEPAWIVSGHWTMELASQNDTAVAGNATTNTTSAEEFGNITGFNAMVFMVMLDGTAMHTHEMSNFTQQETEFDNLTNETTLTGTSTITMREGPVNDVLTEMTLSNGTMAIQFPDPEIIDTHFGNTPVYGIIVTPEMIQQFMGMMDHRGGNMTTTTAANSTTG